MFFLGSAKAGFRVCFCAVGLDARLLNVDVTPRKGSLPRAQVSIEGDAVHPEFVGPFRGYLRTPRQQFPIKDLLHGAFHSRVVVYAGRQERGNVPGLWILCVVLYAQLIERHKGHPAQFSLFQAFHQERRGRVRIDNDVKEGVLRRDLHRCPKLGVFEGHVFQDHAKVLPSTNQTLPVDDSLEGTESQRGVPGNAPIEIVVGAPAGFPAFRECLGEALGPSPGVFANVHEFEALVLPVFQSFVESLEGFVLASPLGLAGFDGCLEVDDLAPQIRQGIPLLGEDLLFLRLLPLCFPDLLAEGFVPFLLRIVFLPPSLSGVQAIDLAGGLVPFLFHFSEGVFFLPEGGLLVVEASPGRVYFAPEGFEFGLVAPGVVPDHSHRALQLFALEHQVFLELVGRAAILFQQGPVVAIALEFFRLDLEDGVGVLDVVVCFFAVLVELGEFPEMHDPLVLDVVEDEAGLAQFLVVEGVLEGLAIAVQGLVDGELLLFALQFVETLVDVSQDGIDLLDRLRVLLHLDE
mmetsp:Transcript_1837/g.4824  ORF Transcript_1837/g.4824 Transcript_1837/m.4824 type:complete len:519 (+) Transcript_1837:1883-3439(+)